MYQALVVIAKCLKTLVLPLPKVFYRQGGQEGCCLYLFSLALPPQRAGNKHHKSNHSWGQESKNSRAHRTPKHIKLQLIPKGRQSSDMCFPYHCTHSSILSSLMGIKSSHTQTECSQHHSFHAYQVDSIPNLADD